MRSMRLPARWEIAVEWSRAISSLRPPSPDALAWLDARRTALGPTMIRMGAQSIAECLFRAFPNVLDGDWERPHGLDPRLDFLRQTAYDQAQALIAFLGYEPVPQLSTGRHALPWLGTDPD